MPLAPLAAHRLAVAFVALCGVWAAGAAQAQKMRPGLWEKSVAMKSSGGQIEAAMAQARAQLAAMPPEQRAQIEAMMAHQGVGMAADKPTTLRICITPEMAARDEFNPGDSRCKSSSFTRSGNTVRFKFSCDTERGPSSGEGEYTLVSDTETRSKMFVNTMHEGKPMRMDMKSSGRWLGASCGDLKPIAPRK